MNNRAVLLANLGSPDSPDAPSVRRYLDQFLMDPSVLQLPWLVRRLLVSLLILPSRPKASAHAYQQVWTADGSPLVALSKKLLAALQNKTDIPVAMSMRYGNPSIESQLLALAKQEGINEILFIPLFPHYAESTVGTALKEARRVIAKHKLQIKLSTLPSFYKNEDYLNTLVKNAQPYLEKVESFDHFLFSYHGLPEIHIRRDDVTGSHCLKDAACCSTPSAAHDKCYRHQVFQTTQGFVKKAGLTEQQYSIAFQSRLGKAKWLEPSTEETLVKLAHKGVRNLLVMCPAFVTDCLETLEEIEIRGAEIFKEAGGEKLTLIPCLNAQPEWVDTLALWCEK